MKYIVVIAALLIIVQFEMMALLMLHKQNLSVWESQEAFNASVIEVLANQCFTYDE